MPQKTWSGAAACYGRDGAGLRESASAEAWPIQPFTLRRRAWREPFPSTTTNGQDRPEIDQKKIDRIILNYF